MSAITLPAAKTCSKRRRGGGGNGSSLIAQGEPMVWLTGGGLALATLMIIGLLALVLYQGIFTFWPSPLIKIETHDGKVFLGEVTRYDNYQPTEANLASATVEGRGEAATGDGWFRRRLLRSGNFEISGEHFDWISDYQIAGESMPPWAFTIERLTWGRFYGFPDALRVIHPLTEKTAAAATALAKNLPADNSRRLLANADGQLVPLSELAAESTPESVVEEWADPEDIWRQYPQLYRQVEARREKRRCLEKHDTGTISHRLEAARLSLRKAQMVYDAVVRRHGTESSSAQAAAAKLANTLKSHDDITTWANDEFLRVRNEINEINRTNSRYRLVMATAGGQSADIAFADIVRAYPANHLTWPQRVGIYLSRWREFLLDDPREANMEGGVFPAIFGTLVMTLVMSLVVAPFGVLAALYLREYAKAGPMISAVRIAINNLAGVPSIVFGVFGLGFFCYLVGGTIDEVFFSAKLPSPTFGTGGLMWASFTLALLTLPVVIVATEEALAAVPGSMREGSYATGASKWQTIRRIVLPRAMPGIMTGMILAMARGAGEVAPLMLVGAVKLAPELPIDTIFPYLHPERSFMHLGFHIFDLGFQSQNSEAAKPMVFTTTLLLITIVAMLNVFAVVIRNRLRKRFATGAF